MLEDLHGWQQPLEIVSHIILAKHPVESSRIISLFLDLAYTFQVCPNRLRKQLALTKV